MRLIRPLLAATMLLLAPVCMAAQDTPAATPPNPAATAKSSYPDGKSLLEKSVAAVGGAEARAKRKSMEMKGTMEMPGQNLKGPIVSRYAQPNKMVTIIDLPGIGEIRSGFDGTVGWSTSKIQGARLMTPKEVDAIAREADYMKDVDPMKRFDTVETVGEGTFAGFDCWKVQGLKKTAGGDDKTVMWFEKSTGLPRGMAMSIETQLGKLPVTTSFIEYKDFDGIKLPVRTEATQAGAKLVTVFDSIVFDSVDPAAFELPTEIKALLEPEPADEDGADAPAPAEPATPATPTTPAAPAKP